MVRAWGSALSIRARIRTQGWTPVDMLRVVAFSSAWVVAWRRRVETLVRKDCWLMNGRILSMVSRLTFRLVKRVGKVVWRRQRHMRDRSLIGWWGEFRRASDGSSWRC